MTSSQPYPPLRHCAIVGEGWAGPPNPSIFSDHSRHSAASASRAASLARWRAPSAGTLAPMIRSPKIRCLVFPPMAAITAAIGVYGNPLQFGAGNGLEPLSVGCNLYSIPYSPPPPPAPPEERPPSLLAALFEPYMELASLGP